MMVSVHAFRENMIMLVRMRDRVGVSASIVGVYEGRMDFAFSIPILPINPNLTIKPLSNIVSANVAPPHRCKLLWYLSRYHPVLHKYE